MIGRSSFAPLNGATARQVSACHAEAFGVGGLDVERWTFSGHRRPRFVPIGALLVGMRDLLDFTDSASRINLFS